MPIYLNDVEIKNCIFPGGEIQVILDEKQINQLKYDCKHLIKANIFNSNDILSLLLSVNAIKNVNPSCILKLKIPYFPYARQDRICRPGQAISVKVMAELINYLRFEEVYIYDPHSDVASALIDNVIVIQCKDLIKRSRLFSFIKENNLTLVSPDSGSEKKINSVQEMFKDENIHLDVVYCYKKRCPETGLIKEVRIDGEIKDRNLIIIDDICDGGQTFINISKKLKEKGAKEIYLFVSHGIFSKGLKVLEPHFNKVFCSNKFPSFCSDSFLEII